MMPVTCRRCSARSKFRRDDCAARASARRRPARFLRGCSCGCPWRRCHGSWCEAVAHRIRALLAERVVAFFAADLVRVTDCLHTTARLGSAIRRVSDLARSASCLRCCAVRSASPSAKPSSVADPLRDRAGKGAAGSRRAPAELRRTTSTVRAGVYRNHPSCVLFMRALRRSECARRGRSSCACFPVGIAAPVLAAN